MQGQLITRTENLSDITVSAGTTQIAKVETLRNIHAIHLHCTDGGAAATYAHMAADIDRIVVRIGGQVIVDAPPEFLWARYHYYHDRDTVVVPSADLPIFFMPDEMPWSNVSKYWRIGMKANEDKESTMANNMTIEVTWAAVVGNIDRCVPYIETDDDMPETIGDHIRILPFNTTWPAASRQDIDTLDRELPIRAARAYWFPLAVGTVSHFEIIENNAFRLRNVPVQVLRQQAYRAGRVHQTTWEVAPLNLGNDPSSIVPINSLTRFVVSPTWSVLPGGYTLYQEVIARGLTGA